MAFWCCQNFRQTALQALQPEVVFVYIGAPTENILRTIVSTLFFVLKMPQCSVPGCTKPGGHKFPKQQELCQAWIVAVRRENPLKKGELWKPGPSARVCHNHFDENDYKATNYYGDKPSNRQLKDDAVPHVFAFSKTQAKTTDRSLRAQKRSSVDEERALERANAWLDVSHDVEVCAVEEVPTTQNESLLPEVVSTCDSSVQTEGGVQLFSAKKFSDLHLHYYTGLETYSKFAMVLETLGPAAYRLNYYYGVVPSLSVEDQFFMTLIKMRTHPPNMELSINFGVSEKMVSNIFITWINFMYHQWRRINWWPSRELVDFYCPSDFKAKFPKTRVIVDGTECPIQKPKQPVAQQATFSSYKNRNTMKVLVGATPGGLVSFVSPAFGGSTSDRQIVERTNLAGLCDPGDEIMADKGFNVDDLLIPHQVSLNIPTFVRKRNRLSAASVVKDRKIASKRVHIERIIGLAKTYKILRDPMNHIESSLATEIITVAFLLCNFRNRIVSRDA